MEATKNPRQSSDYRLEAIDGEVLLYHPERTKTLYLNETASLVWNLCSGERTADEIVRLLEEAFPDAEATVSHDVEQALRRLHEHKAIEYR